MIGATAIMLAGGGPALMPLVVGLLAALVAYGRWASLVKSALMDSAKIGSEE